MIYKVLIQEVCFFHSSQNNPLLLHVCKNVYQNFPFVSK